MGTVYVADSYNVNRIRKITPTGSTSTLAGNGVAGYSDNNVALSASFNYPFDVAVDSTFNIYVTDLNNQRIRRISPGGSVFTLAGNGNAAFADNVVGTSASFNSPMGIAVDVSGNLYVADRLNHRIRFISPSGSTSTLAGNGAAAYADNLVGTSASFNMPSGIAVDSSGNVFVGDWGNHRVRKVSPTGVTTTLAGSGVATFSDNTAGLSAAFNAPQGVAVDSKGNVFVADNANNRVRVIFGASTVVSCDSTWHHLAITQGDGSSSTSKTYVDGALVSTSSQTFTIPADGTSQLNVGWNGVTAAGASQFFNGSLADLRLYSRALSPSEVLALAQPSVATVPNAVASPAAPSLGATSYTYTCSGSTGAPGTLVRSLADNSWSWLSGSAPVCTLCAAGTVSLPGSGICALCPPGTYSLAGACVCSPCPAGTYGNRAGLSSAACSGACASCPAGSAGSGGASSSPLSCAPASTRAISTSYGLMIWPASHPTNPLGADLVVAPQPLCGQMSPGGVCNTTSANSILGADGTLRYAIGSAAQLNMVPQDSMVCSAT